MRLRMPKLHELEKKAFQCGRCGQKTWFTYFPHRNQWICPCKPEWNEAWDELRASCLNSRLNWGCLMPALAVIAFWCVIVGMACIALFRSCVLPWAWYCQ